MNVLVNNYNGVSLKRELTNADVREIVTRYIDGTDCLDEQEERVLKAFMASSKNVDNSDYDTLVARMCSWKKWRSFHRHDTTIESQLLVMDMVLSGDAVIMREIPLAMRNRALAAGMTEEELDA